MRYGMMASIGLLVAGGLRGEGADPVDWIAPSVHFNGAVGSSSADAVELRDHEEHTVWAQLGLSWGGSEVR